jgi:hypothetical protein
VVAGAGVQQVDGLRPLAARGLALVGGLIVGTIQVEPNPMS